MDEAAKSKTDKYADLVNSCKERGYKTNFITIEVGSRGLPNIAGFVKLKRELGLDKISFISLMIDAAKLFIPGLI